MAREGNVAGIERDELSEARLPFCSEYPAGVNGGGEVVDGKIVFAI